MQINYESVKNKVGLKLEKKTAKFKLNECRLNILIFDK